MPFKSSWSSPLGFFSWSDGYFSTTTTAVLVPLTVMISCIWSGFAVDGYNKQKFLEIEHDYLVEEIKNIRASDSDLMLVERRVNEYNVLLSKCINDETNFSAFYNFDLDYLKNDLGYISFAE